MRNIVQGIELEQVTVEAPCPKRWQDLEGGDTRRFCGDCALHVVNLSALTRKEGQAFLDQSAGDERVCVSTQRRPDGSLVTADRSRPWRVLARVAAAFLFGLFPLLAACRQTTGDVLVEGADGVQPDDGAASCIELTGEVALPMPQPSHQLDVPERLLGRIAAPAPQPGPPVEDCEAGEAR